MKDKKSIKNFNNLLKAIINLKTTSETKRFLRDLCTIEEIRAMNERWQIVLLLRKGLSYREIAKKLKTSTTTVSRVSFWLNNGEGGYKLALQKLNKSHHKNSRPNGKELR